MEFKYNARLRNIHLLIRRDRKKKQQKKLKFSIKDHYKMRRNPEWGPIGIKTGQFIKVIGKMI